MNLKELNAALIVFGGALTTLFGDAIMVGKHIVTLCPNGNINVDQQTIGHVGKHTDPEDKMVLVNKIMEICK